MVRVEVRRNATGEPVGFVASGHAGFGVKGSDIVCAAVSVLTQTAVLALPKHAGVTPHVAVDEESGWLECELPSRLDGQQRERARVIFETMVTGIAEIAREYKQHVSLKEVVQR